MPTYFSLLKTAESVLAAVSTEADVEAMVLCQTVFDLNRAQVLTYLNDPVSDAGLLMEFRRLVSLRCSGQPLAYVLGSAWFMGRVFSVTPGVLIPRQDTEILAETVINMAHSACTVLELGFGSGCVSVSVAVACPAASVLAWDVSATCYDVAMENKRRYACDNLQLFRGDFFGASDVWQSILDSEDPVILMSNPPYIPSADMDGLDAQVREYEPYLALDGGLSGLDYYEKLLAVLTKARSAIGVFEMGIGQSELIRKMVDRLGGHMQTVLDFNGIERVAIITGLSLRQPG